MKEEYMNEYLFITGRWSGLTTVCVLRALRDIKANECISKLDRIILAGGG